MPTPLLFVAAKIINAGGKVEIFDENIEKYNGSSKAVGIGLIGAPYIPEAIKIIQRIKKKRKVKFLLGGPVVSGLTPNQFKILFGDDSKNGNVDSVLIETLGLKANKLLNCEKVSIIPAYELLSDKIMKLYLSRTFCLHLSRGCKYSCTFCAAERTRKDPITKKIIKVKERYRDLKLVEEELRYLITRAKRLKLNKISLYPSNLDLFQTPKSLEKFAEIVNTIKSDLKFDIEIRGLSTAHSFLKTAKEYPYCISKMVKAGLNLIGFGIDGMSCEVWKRIKKNHNYTKEELTKKKSVGNKLIEAVRIAKDYNIKSEMLMVFGHVGADTKKSLKAAVKFIKRMVKTYGAIPRPYVAKLVTPGNVNWCAPENAKFVETLINNPEAFQVLDYAALASPLTHPDKKFRKIVNKYYLKICNMKENVTYPVQPIEFKNVKKKVVIGKATLYLGDCRDILLKIPKVDTIITDPVWPDCPEKYMPGWENPIYLFDSVTSYFPKVAERVVIQMGYKSDPRILSSIPSSMPYLRTCRLTWGPWKIDNFVHDANYAFIFGKSIPNKLIPGECRQKKEKDQIVKGHPCPRSLDHVNWLVRWFSEKRVLDPFMGSGTTGVACVKQNKEFIGIEIDEKYFKIACKRIKEEFEKTKK